jgi:two-component system KDP operon response regulator KdpE
MSLEHTPVLIVEDEEEIQRFLRFSLETHGAQVTIAPTAKEALQVLARQKTEIMLLDLGLPDKDGLEVIQTVRQWSQLPIIVLSARGQEADKIKALEEGADDYLTKPFGIGELIARMQVALRHARKLTSTGDAVFTHGQLSVDFSAHQARIAGEALRLTPLEYKLLSVLVRNAGKVLTYSHLLREIWGKYAADNTTNLRIHMQHLRQKLGDDPLYPTYIQTEPGVGYRFKQ